MHVVTDARAAVATKPLPLVASRGALLPPSLLALVGRPPPLPKGEAVIMISPIKWGVCWAAARTHLVIE